MNALYTFIAPLTGIALTFYMNPILGIITLALIAIIIIIRSK